MADFERDPPSNLKAAQSPLGFFLFLVKKLPYSGLATDTAEFRRRLDSFEKSLRAWSVKDAKPGLPVLVSLQGGTGTGKSTLFNALAGRPLSRTGVERPKTRGPILYVHEEESSWLEGENLLSGYVGDRTRERPGAAPELGDPSTLRILEHRDPRWKGLILIDTPDVDSLAEANRAIAEDIYIASDVVCLVTSQEKYGDLAPFEVLRRSWEDAKTCCVILNKMESLTPLGELAERLSQHASPSFCAAHLFALPWEDGPSPDESLAKEPEIDRLRRTLRELGCGPAAPARAHEMAALKQRLMRTASALAGLLQAERETADALAAKWERTTEDLKKELLRRSSGALDGASRQHLRTEVQRVFRRYDLLRGPRTFVTRLLTAPLALFGYGKPPDAEQRRRDLARIHRKIDLQPLQASVRTYNRRAQQDAMGMGRGRLSELFSDPGLALTEEEVETAFFQRQAELEDWLQKEFTSMAKGISKGKEWGIYSTALLWGLFLVVFEAIIGGGLTFFEAVLDSVIMPFISRGAADLFAYQELKRLGQALDARYREQLASVLDLQHARYLKVLNDNAPQESDLDLLRKALADMNEAT